MTTIEFSYQECDDIIEALEDAIDLSEIYQTGAKDKAHMARWVTLKQRLLKARELA